MRPPLSPRPPVARVKGHPTGGLARCTRQAHPSIRFSQTPPQPPDRRQDQHDAASAQLLPARAGNLLRPPSPATRPCRSYMRPAPTRTAPQSRSPAMSLGPPDVPHRGTTHRHRIARPPSGPVAPQPDQPQNVPRTERPFGGGPDGPMDDQVTAHIGYARGCGRVVDHALRSAFEPRGQNHAPGAETTNRLVVR